MTTIRISPVTGRITTDSKITALIMIPVQTAQINLTAVKRTKTKTHLQLSTGSPIRQPSSQIPLISGRNPSPQTGEGFFSYKKTSL